MKLRYKDNKWLKFCLVSSLLPSLVVATAVVIMSQVIVKKLQLMIIRNTSVQIVRKTGKIQMVIHQCGTSVHHMWKCKIR